MVGKNSHFFFLSGQYKSSPAEVEMLLYLAFVNYLFANCKCCIFSNHMKGILVRVLAINNLAMVSCKNVEWGFHLLR